MAGPVSLSLDKDACNIYCMFALSRPKIKAAWAHPFAIDSRPLQAVARLGSLHQSEPIAQAEPQTHHLVLGKH